MRCVFGLLVAVMLVACSETPASWPLQAPLPERLEDLGVLERDGDALRPRSGFAYDLGHALFSDYSSKYRTVHLPDGQAAAANGAEAASVLQFPVGTIITKTFYYPVAGDGVALRLAPGIAGPDEPLALAGMRLVETRILRHQAEGWEAVAYLWDADGREARRTNVGALLELTAEDGRTFDYLVPDRNQCAACHGGGREQRALAPIGPKPANLAALEWPAHGDQYAVWRQRTWVEDDTEVTAWPRGPDARAYLDVNCAHCHRGSGTAASAGLDLRYDAQRAFELGVCKPPVAAGRGAGGLAVGIWPGRPEASIMMYRMAHSDPAVMMPELGRSLVHHEAVALVGAWITELEGDCTHAGLL